MSDEKLEMVEPPVTPPRTAEERESLQILRLGARLATNRQDIALHIECRIRNHQDDTDTVLRTFSLSPQGAKILSRRLQEAVESITRRVARMGGWIRTIKYRHTNTFSAMVLSM